MSPAPFVIAPLLASLAIAGARHAPVPVPSPSPTAQATPLPYASPRVLLNPTGTTPEQSKLIAQAQDRLARTQASACFHDFLAKRAVIQIEPLTPAQFADKARDAKGAFGVKVYHLPWYRAWSSEVGLEGSGGVIQVRDTALTTPCSVASLAAHEAIGHNLMGLGHDYLKTVRRAFSGPYSLNMAVERCCVE